MTIIRHTTGHNSFFVKIITNILNKPVIYSPVFKTYYEYSYLRNC